MTTQPERHDELADVDVTFRMPAWRPVLGALASPAGARAVGVLVGGVVLFVGARSPRLYAVVIAVVLLAWAAGEGLLAWRARGRAARLRAAALIAAAAVLVSWPAPSLALVGLAIGGGLLARGIVGIVRATRSERDDRYLELAARTLTAALGLAVLLVPTVLLDLALALLAVAWVAIGGLQVARLTATRGEPASGDGWPAALAWLHGRAEATQDRPAIFAAVFFEGDVMRVRVWRFLVLMAFATTIASLGIAVDSTAVVIGAMLIAPLMTPLMATALAVTMGWPRRTLISILVALSGVVLAIGLSALIGATIPYDIPVTNPQIASRVSPTLADLFIALAAGGAGAFALSRRDVSDALPGVAVAIALVPPLAVVGLTLQAGDGAAAAGGMLLFTTNLVAILLAGAIVFVVTGIVPLEQLVSNQRWIRSTLTLVVAIAVVVLVPLGLSGGRILAEAFDRQTTQDAVRAWLDGQTSEITELSVQPDAVFVRLTGPEQPPDVDALVERLERDLGRPVEVEVRWVRELTLESGPAG
jgi:uncharacterized hydrophobic protein (TIGR00271 family)